MVVASGKPTVPDENTVSDERMSAPFAHVVNCGESLSEARRGGPRHNTGTGSQLKKGDRFFVGRFHYLDHTSGPLGP